MVDRKKNKIIVSDSIRKQIFREYYDKVGVDCKSNY